MSKTKDSKKIKLYKKKVSGGSNRKWIISIVLLTFIISSIFTFISDTLLLNVGLFEAFIILIVIILIGIIFDIIGVAVTAADETPFHSIASRKVKGAKTAVSLIRNADKVSNFCSDVVGDICGVLGGAAGAVIIDKIMQLSHGNKTVLTIALSAIIASLMVGGKAIGKNIGIVESNNIIFYVAWLIETIKKVKG